MFYSFPTFLHIKKDLKLNSFFSFIEVGKKKLKCTWYEGLIISYQVHFGVFFFLSIPNEMKKINNKLSTLVKLHRHTDAQTDLKLCWPNTQ